MSRSVLADDQVSARAVVAEFDWDTGQETSAQLCVEQDTATEENMRQKTDDLGYVEKQIIKFETDEYPKKDGHVPNLSSSPSFTPFMRSFSSSFADDISSHNNAVMDVLDIKTMLLKMKRLLEQVTF